MNFGFQNTFGLYPPFIGRRGFPGGSVGKESTCNAGDGVSIPGSGRSPGGGHGNSLQCFCLENLLDRGACRAVVHRLIKRQTQLKQLSAQHTHSMGRKP